MKSLLQILSLSIQVVFLLVKSPKTRKESERNKNTRQQTIHFYVTLPLFWIIQNKRLIRKQRGREDCVYLHTRAKRRFLGLWNCSQSLSLANSTIFFLRRSRVTLSASSGPVISLLSNKEKWLYYKKRTKTHRLDSERQLALISPDQPRTSLCSNFLGKGKRERERESLKKQRAALVVEIEESLVLYLLPSWGYRLPGMEVARSCINGLFITWIKKDTCRFPFILASVLGELRGYVGTVFSSSLVWLAIRT